MSFTRCFIMTANRSGEYKIIEKAKRIRCMNRLWARCRTTGSLNYNMYFSSHFHPIHYEFYHTKILNKLPILLCKMIKIQRLHSADRQKKMAKSTMRCCVHSCLICSWKKFDRSLSSVTGFIELGEEADIQAECNRIIEMVQHLK